MAGKYFKLQLITAAWMFIANSLQAQNHYNTWFRTTCSLPVGNKIRIDGELQHRRQNDLDSQSPFDRPLMLTVRGWIHYQYSEHFKLSISPFAYFSNYRIVQHHADETAMPVSETRFSAAAEWLQKIQNKWNVTERNAIEYRIFGNDQQNITRLRNRLGVRYDITQDARLGIYDELFCNVAGTSAGHFFDHNRIGVILEYKILPDFKLETGYIYISRLPVTSNSELAEHNIFLHLTYQLERLK